MVFGPSPYRMPGPPYWMDPGAAEKEYFADDDQHPVSDLTVGPHPNLASHLLGLCARRICRDWEQLYNHEIVFLETFVDPARGFSGTCYKAANWTYLGQTTGRGKDDQSHKVNRSLKFVFGYPLRSDFRQVLYG